MDKQAGHLAPGAQVEIIKQRFGKKVLSYVAGKVSSLLSDGRIEVELLEEAVDAQAGMLLCCEPPEVRPRSPAEAITAAKAVPNTAIDMHLHGEHWPGVVVGAQDAHAVVVQQGTFNLHTVPLSRLRASLEWRPPSSGSTSGTGDWVSQSLPPVYGLLVAELRANHPKDFVTSILQHLRYSGLHRRTAFYDALPADTAGLTWTDERGPLLWAGRVRSKPVGCSFLQAVAARIHDVCSETAHANFTQSLWDQMLAQLPLTEADLHRLDGIIAQAQASACQQSKDKKAELQYNRAGTAQLNGGALKRPRTNTAQAKSLPVECLHQSRLFTNSSAVHQQMPCRPLNAGDTHPADNADAKKKKTFAACRKAGSTCQHMEQKLLDRSIGNPTPGNGSNTLLQQQPGDNHKAMQQLEQVPSSTGCGAVDKPAAWQNTASYNVSNLPEVPAADAASHPAAAAGAEVGTAAGLHLSSSGTHDAASPTIQQTASGSAGTLADNEDEQQHCLVVAALQQLRGQRVAVKCTDSTLLEVCIQAQRGEGGEASVWEVAVVPGSCSSSSSTSGNMADGQAISCLPAALNSSAAGSSLNTAGSNHTGEFSSALVGRRLAMKVAIVLNGPETAADSQKNTTVQQHDQQCVKEAQQQAVHPFQAEYDCLQGMHSKHVLQACTLGYVYLHLPVSQPQNSTQTQQQEQQRLIKVGVPCMLTELADMDLAAAVEEYNKMLRESTGCVRTGMAAEHCKIIFKQVLLGVLAAHAQGTVHRDLKARNILGFVPSVPSSNGVPHELQPWTWKFKVADFGLAFTNLSAINYPKTYLGTEGPGMAPEVRMAATCKRAHYGAEVDQVGIAAAYLHCRFGLPAFWYCDDDEERWTAAELYNDESPYNQPGADLFVGGPLDKLERVWLALCLDQSSHKRKSVLQLLQYDFMQEVVLP